MEVIDNANANTTPEPRQRGIWLSGFLILMFIGNPITAYSYITNADLITQLYPAMTIWLLRLLVLLAVTNIVLAAAVWQWRKWGVFGFYGVAAVAFAVNMYVGIGISGSVLGLAGAVLMFLITKSRWQYFS